MSDTQHAEKISNEDDQQTIVNDFQIIIATVNGTGSQTANTLLLRSLFRMGIPVCGKNVFPSNIQGLPTWFTVRVSKDGYIARKETSEVLVAMNQVTIGEDIGNLPPGGVCIYPSDWKVTGRDDIHMYPVPVKELLKSADVPSHLRDYVSNMVYVGALAALLDIEMNEIEEAVKFHFSGKTQAAEMNMMVVRAAYEWSMDNFPDTNPYRVKRLDLTKNMIMLDGNSAGALGAIFGGVTLVAWYPITPSTSLVDALREYVQEMRLDPETGKSTCAVVQAEDELAAIGMVIGGGWAGGRAMTATSGPGLSLMSEFAGLSYFSEIPAVIWDVQRVGPSTGLPTRTSQGDVMMAYFLGHGDSKHIVLLPNNLNEAFEFGWRALDLADRFQTLVLVLSDLDLGMNTWMSAPFEYPDEPIDRGKVLSAEDLDRLGKFSRYKDVDGDGIAYRTLPGTRHPLAAYFTRGTGHDEHAIYSERPEHWVANTERLNRKFDTARSKVPAPVIEEVDGAQFGVIAYGTTHPAVVEGRDLLRRKDIPFDYLRLRALPPGEDVRKFIEKQPRCYVFENNSDGQMAKILQTEYPEYASKIVSLAHLDGLPLTAERLLALLLEKENA
jgi:2-oxoglutarate ferredoxin oxidoreductase subunit alpha